MVWPLSEYYIYREATVINICEIIVVSNLISVQFNVNMREADEHKTSHS